MVVRGSCGTHNHGLQGVSPPCLCPLSKAVPKEDSCAGAMCCLQEGGNTELLPGKSRVAASLKFPAHASWGARRGTELGGAWVFVFSLLSACQRCPPPGGQDGQIDVAGLSNACGGLQGAPCALISPPASVLTAAAANSLPSQSSAFNLILSQDCSHH